MKGPSVSTEHLLCPRQHAWQYSMCELILQHPCKEDTNIPIFDRAGNKPRDIKELSQDHTARDFPGGPVVKNPPAKKKKRIRLPIQETQVQFLVPEDPTYLRAAKPLRRHY